MVIEIVDTDYFECNYSVTASIAITINCINCNQLHSKNNFTYILFWQ